ncbi:MAG: serine protease [Acidobacteriia bacterium]|nr:serine protease [Terriglobia bacterium]
MQNLFRILSTALLINSLCSAANVSDHLVGVHSSSISLSFPKINNRTVPYPIVKGKSAKGSGICINENCSIVATAHNIQMLTGRATLRVTSGHTEKVLSAASDNDPNKAEIPITKSKQTLFYNIANDVSFVYTRKPIPHKSGIPYSYKVYVGQKVQVAGYYNRKFQSKEARIIGSNVHLVVGRAQLTENLILDIALNPGNSGSAVLDERGNLLGMVILTGALKLNGGDITASVALPVRAIAKALVELDPVLGPTIFNDIPEDEPKPIQTQYVLYQDSDLPEDTSPVIPGVSAVHSDVTNAVDKLHAKSEIAFKLTANLVAKQCLVQGTQEPLCHELAFVEGQQTFRKIGKDGRLGKPVDSFPIQKHGVWVQSDWADTLGEIAEDPWVFQGSVDDHYLFSFKAAAEDERCYFEERPQGVPLFGGWHPDWEGSVACFEEVLTDKNFNVLSVFAELHPPDTCLTQLLQKAIYYDWVKLEGLQSPVLLPVKERITAKVLRQDDLWYANLTWTDYKQFRAKHRIKF